MPQNITDVNTYTAPIVVPADGDVEAAAGILASFQGLANRTEFLRNRVRAAYVTGQEYEVPLVGATFSSNFISNASGVYQQSVVTSAGSLKFRLDPPQAGAHITGIRARVLPAVTGRAAPPATLPALTLYSTAIALAGTSIPVGTVVATVSGTYANTAAYEQIWDISTVTAGALPATIASGTPAVAYRLEFTGETGTNSVVNLNLIGLYVTWSA